MPKLGLAIFSLLVLFSYAYAAEEKITLTTYYPSPYGSYKELTWGNIPNSRGYLKNDQGASIELGGSGSPYIDFSNDMGSDYDARIQLTGNDELTFSGLTAISLGGVVRINTCVRVPFAGAGITYCPSCYYVSAYLAAASGEMVCCLVSNPGC